MGQKKPLEPVTVNTIDEPALKGLMKNPANWGWTVAVVSSPNSISADPHDRNNHIFFYEKVEQLVEACWMLRNKDQ